jgi:hypothetical protein
MGDVANITRTTQIRGRLPFIRSSQEGRAAVVETQLNPRSCAEAERAALAAFDKEGWQWGWKDCQIVLRDWFPRLRERARQTQDPDEDVSINRKSTT